MKNLIRFITLLLIVCLGVNLRAAKLSVRSFGLEPFDMTASTKPRPDRNGIPCALVVVELPVPGCDFKGNTFGEIEFNGSQYMVYVTANSKQLQILCPGAESLMVDLRDANGEGVASKSTYKLYIDGYPEPSQGNKPAGPNGSYLTVSITPKTSVVLKINGKMEVVDNGEYAKFLTPGKYDISVEAPGYETFSNQIVIDGSGKKNLDIKLESIMAELKVVSKTPNTVIKIDGKERGTDNVTVNLSAGQYLIEAVREGYRSLSQMVELNDKEKKTVTLDELTPVYGAIDINYRPFGATILVDGQQVGTTPDILSEVTIGRHEISVTKDGFEPFKGTVKVVEGETLTLSGTLEEQKEDAPIAIETLLELKKKYDSVGDFSEGLAYVRQNDMYGFVDKEGQVVIPIAFGYAHSFSEGLAPVHLNGENGYIDKTGQVIIPVQYDVAWSFREGLAGVRQNGKWGFIDKTGNIVIPIKYDNIGSFSEGLAKVQQNGKWGFIDKTGQVVIPFKYDDAIEFSEGLATVKKNGKYGYINKTGQVVVPIKYDDAFRFSEGMAYVQQNGKYGYIDKTGQVVVPFKYDNANDFCKGLAAVEQYGKWGYIDKKGKVVTSFIFDEAYSHREDGLAKVGKNGKYGFIDQNGQNAIPVIYEGAYVFSNGLAGVQLNGKWGWIDKSGKFYPAP